jgi:uncharacterized membrane protein YhfC
MDLLSVTHFLNGFLMISVPIILGFYLTSKFHLGWKVWWIGACVFIISQIFHLPFNFYVLNPILVQIQQSMPGLPGSLVIAILLGLSAGIFETGARYGMYCWWLKDNRMWRVGVLAGAGHGAMEAIILGGLVMLTYFNMMAYRNLDLSYLNVTPDQLDIARQQIQTYWSLPWYETMLGAWERMFTIPFHIAASVLVLQVFTRKPGHQRLGWLLLAVLLHALMDASSVFISGQYSVYLAEMIIAALAVLDIYIIFALRQPDPDSSPPLPPLVISESPNFTIAPLEETADHLENTRYL